jgi:hypothetical protein
MIGGYVRDESAPGPGADGNYMGVIGTQYFDRNPVDELDWAATGGFTVPATSGAAAGKTARLVSTGASPMTVAADGLCSVSAGGVVTATATTGLYKTYITPAVVIPAGAFMWVFLV